MDFDKALESVGSYGWFQVKMLVTGFIFGFPTAFNIVLPVFLHYTPEHHCSPAVNHNISLQEWLNQSIPIETDNSENQAHSSCKQYNLTTNITSSCENGWTYMRDLEGFESAATEFNLVCEEMWILPFIASWFLGIKGVNIIFVGYLSDRYGRKVLIFSALIIEHITLFLVTLSPNTWFYAVTIIIYSATGPASYITCYSLLSELTGSKWRNRMNLAMNSGYIAGYMSMPLMAYCFPNWRHFVRCILLCGVVYIPIFWIIPESPRWLFSKNRIQKSAAILRRISLQNRTNLKEEEILKSLKSLLEDINSLKNEKIKRLSLPEAFRNGKFAGKLVVLVMVWVFTNITYFGLTMNTSSFGGDRFLNCFLSAVTEFPACLIAYVCANEVGRPITIALTLLIGGVFCIVSPLVKSASVTASAAFAIAGKAGATGAFYIVLGYSPEMSPTLLRNTTFGFCNACSKAAAFLTPYIMLLGVVVNPMIPFCVMGIGSIVSAALTVFILPETKDVNLPETLEDANEMKTKLKCK